MSRVQTKMRVKETKEVYREVLTYETENRGTNCCVEYLVMYFHIITFKKFVLECACKAIKPVSQFTKHPIMEVKISKLNNNEMIKRNMYPR